MAAVKHTENRMKRLLSIAIASTLLGACSWGIKLDSGGEKVRVAWDGHVEGCQDSGKVTVSVLDHVGPVDRSGLKVSDELEIMARNEAATLGADTVKPIGEPHDGAQSWGAYTCGSIARVRVRENQDRADRPPPDAVETYPVKDH